MNFYFLIAVFNFIIFGGFVLGTLIVELVRSAVAFVNDKDFEPLNLWKKFHGFSWTNWSDIVLFIIMGLMIAILIGLIWPLALFVLFIYLLLISLRFGKRVGKKFKKLGDIAHDHPKEVSKTKFDW